MKYRQTDSDNMNARELRAKDTESLFKWAVGFIGTLLVLLGTLTAAVVLDIRAEVKEALAIARQNRTDIEVLKEFKTDVKLKLQKYDEIITRGGKKADKDGAWIPEKKKNEDG